MTGKHLQLMMKLLGMQLKDIAKELHYRPDGVRSWIRRNAEIPADAHRKIIVLMIRKIKEREKKHDELMQLLIAIAPPPDGHAREK